MPITKDWASLKKVFLKKTVKVLIIAMYSSMVMISIVNMVNTLYIYGIKLPEYDLPVEKWVLYTIIIRTIS